MAFFNSLKLVQYLEGGKDIDPRDPGGVTNAGLTQATYMALRPAEGPASVLNASESVIATCYRKLWDKCRIENPEAGGTDALFDILPEPADGVAFQFYINVPPKEFKKLFQAAIGVVADGILGPVTWRALLKFRGPELADKIADIQEAHYREVGTAWDLKGLLNRVDKVRMWIVGKGPLNPAS